MRFAEKLSVLRHEKGLTQEQLAESSGLHIGTIRKYEQGIVAERVNFSYVLALARALGVTCEHFSDCEDVTPEPKKPKVKSRRKK
jgi:transcriptional regulator with XRE-family HTH domain